MKELQAGLTLVEILCVIGIVSLVSIAGVGTVIDHQKQSEVSIVVAQAREIAYVVDRLRRSDMGIAVTGEIALRDFRDRLLNIDPDLPSQHFPVLNVNEYVFGSHLLDFYRVSATEYSVFVSFDLPASEYADIQFDRAVSHLNDSGTITWTVMQHVKSGISNSYAAMNEIYAR